MTDLPNPDLSQPARDFLETHADWMQQTHTAIETLQTRDFTKSAEALKRLAPLSDRYQSQLKFLHDKAEALGALPEDLKSALRQSQLEFAEASAAYYAELEVSMKIGEQFTALIQRSITRQLQTSQFYGNSGGIVNAIAPKAVTVNRSA